MITSLILRTSVYVILRLKSFEKIKGLDSWDPIPPEYTYILGIEEFIYNVILLCYFFGMNASSKSDYSANGESFTDHYSTQALNRNGQR